jgi:hypothetical protein
MRTIFRMFAAILRFRRDRPWPEPLDGLSYTRSELDANPELRSHVLAQREAIWKDGIFTPKVRYKDTPGSGELKAELLTSVR